MKGFVLGTGEKRLPGSPTAKDLSVLERKPLLEMHHGLEGPSCVQEKLVGAEVWILAVMSVGLCWPESKRSHWAGFEPLLTYFPYRLIFIKCLILEIVLVLGADLVKDSRKN